MEALGRNPACIIPAWRDFLRRRARAGARHRRAGVAGPQRRRAGRVQPARVAAQPRVRRRARLAAAVPVRRRRARAGRARGGVPQPPARAPERHQPCQRRLRRPRGVLSGTTRSRRRRSRPPSWPSRRRARARARVRRPTGPPRRASVADRLPDLVLAVNELATNSMRHGGGRGMLRIWERGRHVLLRGRDRGRIDDPLAGRERPDRSGGGGRGLWIVNHLCDLVQVRPGRRAASPPALCASAPFPYAVRFVDYSGPQGPRLMQAPVMTPRREDAGARRRRRARRAAARARPILEGLPDAVGRLRRPTAGSST